MSYFRPHQPGDGSQGVCVPVEIVIKVAFAPEPHYSLN